MSRKNAVQFHFVDKNEGNTKYDKKVEKMIENQNFFLHKRRAI